MDRAFHGHRRAPRRSSDGSWKRRLCAEQVAGEANLLRMLPGKLAIGSLLARSRSHVGQHQQALVAVQQSIEIHEPCSFWVSDDQLKAKASAPATTTKVSNTDADLTSQTRGAVCSVTGDTSFYALSGFEISAETDLTGRLATKRRQRLRKNSRLGSSLSTYSKN